MGQLLTPSATCCEDKYVVGQHASGSWRAWYNGLAIAGSGTALIDGTLAQTQSTIEVRESLPAGPIQAVWSYLRQSGVASWLRFIFCKGLTMNSRRTS
jgi:hypothetical protein